MITTIIFDLDGTLVQTEKLKALSYAKAAAALRPELREEDVIEAFKEVVGLPRHVVAQRLVALFDLDAPLKELEEVVPPQTPWQAFVQMRLRIYEDFFKDPELLVRNQWPHNVELLKWAKGHSCKVGLATMSRCEQVQRVLDVLELRPYFDFVASGEDVELGKPDPQIYLLTAEALGAKPSECLVIEDSPTGVMSALAAGMSCVAVSTPFTRVRLRASGVIDSSWIVDDPRYLCSAVERAFNVATHSL
jgi:beta-phosphoglucomutase-like phosphatase (HAD superfamily)